MGCVPLKRERVVERAVVAQAVRLGGYANWDNAGSRYLNANNSVRNTNRNNGGSAQTLGNLKKTKTYRTGVTIAPMSGEQTYKTKGAPDAPVVRSIGAHVGQGRRASLPGSKT